MERIKAELLECFAFCRYPNYIPERLNIALARGCSAMFCNAYSTMPQLLGIGDRAAVKTAMILNGSTFRTGNNAGSRISAECVPNSRRACSVASSADYVSSEMLSAAPRPTTRNGLRPASCCHAFQNASAHDSVDSHACPQASPSRTCTPYSGWRRRHDIQVLLKPLYGSCHTLPQRLGRQGRGREGFTELGRFSFCPLVAVLRALCLQLAAETLLLRLPGNMPRHAWESFDAELEPEVLGHCKALGLVCKALILVVASTPGHMQHFVAFCHRLFVANPVECSKQPGWCLHAVELMHIDGVNLPRSL